MMHIDGFQMSIKRPTSRGQTHDQEAAVQQTYHLERSSFFLSFSTNGKDLMKYLLPCILYAVALNPDTDFCTLKVKPRPMKAVYRVGGK